MPEERSGRENLSSRERQVAEAYAQGLSYRQIAERFFIAPATVRTHLGTIYRKLGVSTKIELLRRLEGPGGEGAVVGRAEQADAAQTVRPGSQERRQVTILSALPEGLDDLARSGDPEAFAALIGAFRTVAGAAIDRHGGYRLASRSTEVLACFGLPVADETDAERAVRCAIDIGSQLGRDRGQDQPLGACIGLFTGPVITNSMPEGALDLTGIPPLFAAALARDVKGGGIVVCARTHAVLGGLFAFTDLGPIVLDGGPVPLQRFAVGDPIPAKTRFETLHGDRPTPFVGRDHEIGLFETLFRRAQAGEGQAAVVSGEPGIGKSRVVRTLAERLALSPEALLVFQCSPHERSSPLHGIAQTLRQTARVEGFETPSARLDALATLFADAIEEPARDRELLAGLASVRHEPAQGQELLTADRRRAATLALLDRFLCRRAEITPLLVVFEDMHWADPTTVEWLQGIVGLCETLPLMVIATGRPEFAFRPSAAANITTLALARLDRSALARIVAEQGAERPLSPAVAARIVERSEGIPLFAEELTRAILELGEAEDTVPTTLQASLMGRLDRLGAVREVAQAAAVIGRDFDMGLLAEIVPEPARQLEEALDKLLAGRLLLRRGGTGGRSFQFRHALIRDAAYGSLLHGPRRELHGRIADALQSGNDVSPPVLTTHLECAERFEQAIEQWMVAAGAAVATSANAEAIDACGRALALLPKAQGPSSTIATELEIRMLMGVALQATQGYASPRVAENYRRAQVLCDTMGAHQDLFPVKRGLYVYHLLTGHLREAHRQAGELKKIADRTGESAQRLEADFALGQTLAFHTPEVRRGRDLLLDAAATYDADLHGGHAYRYGQDPGVFSLVLAGLISVALGDFDQACDAADAGVELAEVVRHPLSLAAAYVLNAQVNAFMGRLDEARRGAERASAISQQQALPIFLGWSNVILGCVAADLERQRLDDALGMFAVSGTRFTASFCVSQVAERFLLAGDTERAKQLIDLPMRLVGSDDSEPVMAPFVWRVLGLIAAAEGNAAQGPGRVRRSMAHGPSDRLPLLGVADRVRGNPSRQRALIVG